MKLRINKLISDAGLGSRRDVEDYIRAGRVKINGRKARLGDMVEETDLVLFDEVDLPVKDLIKESVAESKLSQNESVKQAKRKSKSKGEERAESQRLQASPKSAALRKTSKNNPMNKKRHLLEDDDDEFGAFPLRTKDRRKQSFKSPKFGRMRREE